MSNVLTSDQRRTAPARAALARKFETPEEKREFYRLIGIRGSQGRVVLSAADAAALAAAYNVLCRIAARVEGGER